MQWAQVLELTLLFKEEYSSRRQINIVYESPLTLRVLSIAAFTTVKIDYSGGERDQQTKS